MYCDMQAVADLGGGGGWRAYAPPPPSSNIWMRNKFVAETV